MDMTVGKTLFSPVPLHLPNRTGTETEGPGQTEGPTHPALVEESSQILRRGEPPSARAALSSGPSTKRVAPYDSVCPLGMLFMLALPPIVVLFG